MATGDVDFRLMAFFFLLVTTMMRKEWHGALSIFAALTGPVQQPNSRGEPQCSIERKMGRRMRSIFMENVREAVGCVWPTPQPPTGHPPGLLFRRLLPMVEITCNFPNPVFSLRANHVLISAPFFPWRFSADVFLLYGPRLNFGEYLGRQTLCLALRWSS